MAGGGVLPPFLPLMEKEKYFERLEGQNCVIEIWPAGDPILFYPGTMLASGHYEVILRSLRDAGLTVVALHFSGHGLAIKSKATTFDAMEEEAWAAEDWAFARFGVCAACGHSQGGILALARAGKSAKLAAAFSICAAFPQREDAIELTRFAPLRRRREELLAGVRWLARRFPRLPIPLPLYLPVRNLLAGKLKPVYMGSDAGRVSYPLEFLASLFSLRIEPELRCPWFLFSARDDALFTPKIIKGVFETARAPRKELIWLPTGGHMAPFNPGLAAFLARSIACACAGLGFSLDARQAAE